MKKERPHPRDSEALKALRAEYAEQRSTGSLVTLRSPFREEAAPPIGWPIWLAWVFGLLGFFLAATTWIFLGLAILTPLTITQTLLTAVLLGPVIGGAVSVPGVIFALLATRRGRSAGASLAVPVTLVWLSTAVLLGGLLFGGLVSYPREVLGAFGQAIQTHCARLEQSLQPYGDPPNISKLQQDPVGVVVILQNDQAASSGDQAALDALTTPDPKYQPLLDDCRSLATKDGQVIGTFLKELIALPPDLTTAQKTLSQYQSDTSSLLAQIQQLGAALKQQIFAPFHPS